MASRDDVMRALAAVIDPELKRPVTELDMVRGVEIDGGRVAVTIALTVAGCPLRHSFEQQVQDAVLPLDGVDSVELAFDVMSTDEKSALVTRLRGGVERRGISLDPATRVIAVAAARAASASPRSPPTSPPPSTRSATASASSTPTSMGTRSRTCSASTSARSSSTR